MRLDAADLALLEVAEDLTPRERLLLEEIRRRGPDPYRIRLKDLEDEVEALEDKVARLEDYIEELGGDPWNC